MPFPKLSETQKLISDLASDFAKKEIQPRAHALEAAGEFPRDIQKKALELGLLNLTIPEAYGGPGLGYFEFVLVTEKLASACPATAAAISLNNMIADVLLVAANEEQKKEYLKKILQGEVGAYGLTEPGAGSDVASIKSTAKKMGSNYVLNGSKTWISNATVADFFIVFAKSNPDAGNKGISAFLVDRKTPGLKIGNALPKLGQKAFPAAEVFLDNVEVHESKRIGIEGQGFLSAMKAFDRSRPMVAAVGVGLTQRCLDESMRYAKNRESMGKNLLGHQLIAAKIADMGMRLEASRLLTYKAALLLDQDEPNTLQASYAKTFASDTAVWAANEAVQIFGGMGYSPEYPVEKLYRDSKVLQIYEGTNEIQRLIIARELSKNL